MNRNSLEDIKILSEIGFDSVVLVVKNISKLQVGKGKTTIQWRQQLEEERGKV